MPDDGDMAVTRGGDVDSGSVLGRVRRQLPAREASRRRRADIERLEARVTRLEAELAQERLLQRRVAELVDVVGQLLVPGDDARSEELLRRLEAYRDRV